MALLGRGGESFSGRRALFWAISWGLGAAIGVALGGWLTLVGGAGAPGAEALDPWTDVVLLPLFVFAVVLAVHLGGQLIASAIRGRRAVQAGEGEADSEDPGSGGDEVAG